MRPFLVALTAAFMPVAASSAEPVEYMGGGYRPSIHILDERTKVCGTSFSAVIGTRRKVLSITGTVFSTWNEGNPPGLAIHVRASEVVNRKLDMGRRRVRPAVFRVDGTDTRSLSAAPRNGGLLLETDAGRSDLVFTFPRSFRKGAWVSLSLHGEPADVTFRLPAFGQADRDTTDAVDRCNEEGLDTVQREMKALGLLSDEGNTRSTRDDAARPRQWR
jgi:hypothetical protein